MESLDAPLFQTLQTLPSFPFALLVRPDRASVRAARSAWITDRKIPSFTYQRADRFDTTTYQTSLNAVADRLETLPALDVVKALYREKVAELRDRLTLVVAIQQHDDTLVSVTADALYGTPAQSAEQLRLEFESILARGRHLHTHNAVVDADAFLRMVHVTLSHYGIEGWTVRLSARSSIAISHASVNQPPLIKIPKTFSASRARAARVLVHEIETHALRTFNGMHSPLQLLGRGLAYSAATEEGLAVALQQRLRDDDAVDPGFWDAWAAALTQTHSFADAYDVLHDARLKLNIAMNLEEPETHANDTAWRLMVRCMRGIHHPDRSGLGYRRDHIYRSGLAQVRSLLAEHSDAILPTLFAGHASIAHIATLQSLGITGRTPDFVAQTIVKNVRREIRKRNSVH